MVPMKSRRDTLVERGIGEKIAGNLLDSEFIEPHIAIKRVDYPIAPPPHVTDTVGLITVGVAIARRLHPAEGHALGVSRRSEQPVDDFFVRARRLVVQESLYLGRSGRQTCQVQRDAPD